jgi:hypothetical protein
MRRPFTVSDLKQALYVLLYDQYDSGDLEPDDSDETFINHIIYALVQKNETVCPFKAYDCVGHCEHNHVGCAEGINFDCNQDQETAWREFIFLKIEKADY